MLCSLCDVPESEEKLYQCETKECRVANKLYCESCGNRVHRRLKHKFLQNPSDEDQDEDKYDDSKKESEIETKDYAITKNKKYIGLGLLGGLGGSTVIFGAATYATPLATTVSGTASTAASFIPTVAAGAMFATAAYSFCSSKKAALNQRNPANARDEAIEIALAMFAFDESDIDRPLRFNQGIITKRYHRLAKYYHPDKKHGDYTTFIRLDISRRILLSLVDPKEFEFPAQDAYKLSCSDEVIMMDGGMKAIEHPSNDRSKYKDQPQNQDTQVQGDWISIPGVGNLTETWKNSSVSAWFKTK